jgi:hypothetical protein
LYGLTPRFQGQKGATDKEIMISWQDRERLANVKYGFFLPGYKERCHTTHNFLQYVLNDHEYDHDEFGNEGASPHHYAYMIQNVSAQYRVPCFPDLVLREGWREPLLNRVFQFSSPHDTLQYPSISTYNGRENSLKSLCTVFPTDMIGTQESSELHIS